MIMSTMNQFEPFAIVGFTCKVPQDAEDEGKFWRMLVEGRCAMTEGPADRFDINSVYHPDHDRLDTASTRCSGELNILNLTKV
jgi:acyl transferase domain-containing protein